MSSVVVSPGQVTCLVAYVWILIIWAVSEFFCWARKTSRHADDHGPMDEIESIQRNGSSDSVCKQVLGTVASTGFVRCLQLNKSALIENNETLRQMVEFGSWIVWYYLCDRTSLFGDSTKIYNRDLFLFLLALLTAVAVGTSIQKTKAPLLLCREQTEEWKGWMQVVFLMYHYFDAREAYNAIRIFIAAYVWMTGYGNFSYYVRTNDFCLGRFAQTMWRLNFSVFFMCVALGNSYMLYYICPMHTLFTLYVYCCLAIGWKLNCSSFWLVLKLVICLVLTVVLWNKKVFFTIWSPFTWLVGYQDPRKPTDEALHEWFFRSGLDRFIWIYGMFCAMLNARANATLKWVDEQSTLRRLALRMLLVSLTLIVAWIYFLTIYCRDKYSYNEVHPYTSWIPITLWIILRNMMPSLRLHHLRLFSWLGCITLETYLGQFHIWMKTNLVDGQPKSLLTIVPGMPLMNFYLVTAGYVFISHRLFQLTNTLKNVAVPYHNKQILVRNVFIMTSSGILLFCIVAGAMLTFKRCFM